MLWMRFKNEETVNMKAKAKCLRWEQVRKRVTQKEGRENKLRRRRCGESDCLRDETSNGSLFVDVERQYGVLKH
jgi:hypothetical protein